MRAISSPWNKQSIQRSLNTVFTGKSLEVVPITTSTLDDAHQAIAHGAPHGHAILADYQTKGRGRSNHTWFSPPHTNIYLSIVLKHGPYPGLTLHAGLACARALQNIRIESHLDQMAQRSLFSKVAQSKKQEASW